MKNGIIGRLTRLAILGLLTDKDGRKIIAWHRNRDLEPGEPDFAKHRHALATKNNRGTIQGLTIAEHADNVIISGIKTGNYLHKLGATPAQVREIRNAVDDQLLGGYYPARQVQAGWHGNGHLLRQRSLNMNGWQYAEVVEEVQHMKGSK